MDLAHLRHLTNSSYFAKIRAICHLTQHVKQFLDYCISQEEEDITDEQEFDDLLLDYIHHLYEEGYGKSKASMTLYGIINVLPNLNGKLPKSAQAVKGWHKQVPGRSYPPLTWELAVTIAVQMA